MASLKPFAASAAVVLGASILVSCSKSESTAKAATEKSAAPAAEAKAGATAGEAPAEVRKLFGRWMRSDGTYVLELKKADMTGVMEAAYFNPKSINVSRSIWMRGPQGFQVVVELNDVGYPGATYVLSHDAQTDRLVGQYTQPQMQQTFDVEFVRHTLK